MRRPGDKILNAYTLIRRIGIGPLAEAWEASGPSGASVLKFSGLQASCDLKEYRRVNRMRHIRSPYLMTLTGIWVLDQYDRELSESTLKNLEAKQDSQETAFGAAGNAERSIPTTFVVAKPLAKQTLADRYRELKGRPFPVDELLRYIEDSARGFDFLNAPHHRIDGVENLSIQHCNVTPANIVLSEKGALVCDFEGGCVLEIQGSASSADAGQALGTIAYMAPECADMGKPAMTSDQYSLAIIYCEMRAGELPFSQEDRRSGWKALAAHVEGRLDLSRLPRPEREVIRRATSVDPAARYPSCLEMVYDLRRAVEGERPPSQ
jgi:serine/threonine protein kinase